MKKEKTLRLLILFTNYALLGFAIVFLMYLVAPLLGAKFMLRSLIISGSIVVYIYLLKIIEIEKKYQLKGYRFLLFYSYNVLCMFIWFRFPLSVLLAIVVTIGFAWEYKRKRKRGRF